MSAWVLPVALLLMGALLNIGSAWLWRRRNEEAAHERLAAEQREAGAAVVEAAEGIIAVWIESGIKQRRSADEIAGVIAKMVAARVRSGGDPARRKDEVAA